MTNNYKIRINPAFYSTYLPVRFLAKIAISLTGSAVLGSTSRFKIRIDDSVKTLLLILARFFGYKTVQRELLIAGDTIKIIPTLILFLPLQKNSFLV